MFGDLMGNMEEKQAQMKEKLSQIELTEEIEGIVIKANAAREILNVSIPDDLATDKDAVEDLIVVGMNNILVKIAEEEAKESQSMISDMLPPGMGNLFG